jgi:hypothetical protein
MDKNEKRAKLIISLIVAVLLLAGGVYVYNFVHKQTTVGAQQGSDKDANGCYTPDTVRNHYGETACVDYNVGYVHETSAGTKFLDQLVNYSSGFVGYIAWNSGAHNMDIDSLLHKDIRVTGLIQKYGGYPEIIINDSSQVAVY